MQFSRDGFPGYMCQDFSPADDELKLLLEITFSTILRNSDCSQLPRSPEAHEGEL